MPSVARAIVLAIVAFKTPCATVLAAPANDAFASATSLGSALPVTVTGDARGATYEAGEPILDSGTYNGSLWYTWTPSTSGSARPVFTWTADGTGIINGSAFRLVVHKGTTFAGLTQLAMGTEVTPCGSFSFTAGQSYCFQVAVWTDASAASFPYAFTLSAAPATPSNDSFASAIVLSEPLPIAASGTTTAATLENGETADSNQARSVWYKWTPGTSGARAFAITTSDAYAQPVLEVFTGTSLSTLARIGRIDTDGTSAITVAAGTVHYLRVLTNDPDGPAGSFTIAISAATTGTPPANDSFATGADLGSELDTAVSATTTSATLETGELAPFSMASTVWFKWTAPSTGWFDVSSGSISGITPALGVWQGTSLTNLRLRASSDAYSSDAVFAASAGDIIYIQAGAQGGYAGDFTLTVSAATDPGIPHVTNILCNPSSVIVGTASKDVTVTITLAGPADGLIAEVDLLIPGGGLVNSIDSTQIVQASGTPGNGTFTAQFTVPKRAPAGTYPLVVYLTNGDGSWAGTCAPASLISSRNPPAAWYDYVDVATGGNFLTVTYTGTQPTAPVLTGFSATASVNTSSAAANISLSATITSNASNVVAASVLWQDPAGLIPADATGLTKSNGSFTNGTWTGTITVPAHTAPGRLNLTVMIWNALGQASSYGYQYGAGGLTDQFDGPLQTIPSGFTSFVTIVNTGAADILPPQVGSLTFSPNPAIFNSADQVDVTVTATVTDALSGVSAVSVDFPDAPTVDPLILNLASGSTYSAVMTFHRGDFPPGTFAPEVQTADGVGNYGTFTPAVPGIASLTLLLPGSYGAWIAGFAIASPDNDPAANPQGDGIVNLLKYAFNMDPTQAAIGTARYLTPITGSAGLPSIITTGAGATIRLRVEYVRRISSPGTTYAVEFTSAPATGWTPATATETVTAIDSLWQRVVVEDSGGIGSPMRFARVNVTSTP